MSRRLDEVMGRRFGRLTVIGVDTKKFVAIALCDCGNIRTPRAWALLSGKQVSCGCYWREQSIARQRNETLQDILDNCTVGGPDECWTWKKRTTDGYGRLRFRGVDTTATRGVWIAVHGSIPPGMIICHKCDNPPCCNPNHLFVGTYKDNAVDMIQKGRQNWSRTTRNKRLYCKKNLHLMSDNEYRAPGDPLKRICRPCMLERQRIWSRAHPRKRTAINTSENV